MRRVTTILAFVFTLLASAQNIYFPPISNQAKWDTVSPAALGWNTGKIEPLYSYLDQQNTKAFILLKDGKIVMEKYFGTFTKDSAWYWASAAKTITSFLVGTAQEGGFLSVAESSSKYLGAGWSDCTPAQEQNITIRHHLTMTTGLDDGVPDNHCTEKSCLKYLAAPGSRWAYHNAPYTLLEKVITAATRQTINSYTQSKLMLKTGITGLWVNVGYDNSFYSKARSMARFGLLALNQFVWNGDTLLRDKEYIRQMISPSQTINKSYGYLWWLNGKTSYMMPGSQFVFPGACAPQAPADMYAGIGKNGQLVCISPSTGLVMVRMGHDPNGLGDVPTVFCNQIWQRLNEVIQTNSSVTENRVSQSPATVCRCQGGSRVTIRLEDDSFDVYIADTQGKIHLRATRQKEIDASHLPKGIYIIRAVSVRRVSSVTFVR